MEKQLVFCDICNNPTNVKCGSITVTAAGKSAASRYYDICPDCSNSIYNHIQTLKPADKPELLKKILETEDAFSASKPKSGVSTWTEN